MRRSRKVAWVLGALALSLAPINSAQAQSMTLEAVLVSSGAGAVEAGSARADLAIGQPAVGRTTSASLTVEFGFFPLGEGGIVSIQDESVPLAFELEANYPNPFTPSTTIAYVLPEAAKVRVDVFDVLGRRVRTLAEGEQGAGRHGLTFSAEALPSGVYFYRLVAGERTATRRMQLIR